MSGNPSRPTARCPSVFLPSSMFIREFIALGAAKYYSVQVASSKLRKVLTPRSHEAGERLQRRH